MTAYVVVDVKIKDEQKLGEYAAKSAETVAKFGGEFLTKAPIEVLFGKTERPMKVIIQFDDTDTARAWYNSDDYQALLAIRSEAIDCDFHLVG